MKYFLGTQQIEYFENAGVTTTIHNYLTTSKNTAGQINIWGTGDEAKGTTFDVSTINRRTVSKVDKGGDEMYGDLLLSIGGSINRLLDCEDRNNETELFTGSHENQIQ